jgi:cyclase
LKLSLVAVLVAAALLPAQENTTLHVLPVQGNVYLLYSAVSNTTLQVGKDGGLLVDTMTEALVPQITAEVKKLTPLPVRYIIDTSLTADHIGGNAALAKAGAPGASVPDGGGATVIANENVLNRLSRMASPKGLPNDEYNTPTKDFYFNGEPVIVFHEPKAHTDGDSIVLFRRSDVIAAGDIFTPDRYPDIDLERGGSVEGLIAALNHLLHLTVPEHLQDGGTRVIPGHGRLCNEADVVEYRDMVTIVRDRIKDQLSKGKSLAEVKASKPTRDYDPQYGPGDHFTETVYRSLGGK